MNPFATYTAPMHDGVDMVISTLLISFYKEPCTGIKPRAGIALNAVGCRILVRTAREICANRQPSRKSQIQGSTAYL